MKSQSMTIALLGMGLAAAPLFAAQPAAAGQPVVPGQYESNQEQAQPARPGTVNYVEGTAYIDGQPINPRDIGSIALDPGQELSTGAGHAEILLTPGVFLRVDNDSAVKMISPNLVPTQVEVDKGRAGIEVDEIHDENNLQIIDAGVTTRLEKTGYYEFNANNPKVKVFSGKAEVELAGNKDRQVKGDHDFLLAENSEPLNKEKPQSFHESASQDELYNWSRLRSEYLAEANNDIAGEYASDAYYPGWYWDPYMMGYTFLGAGPFYSPFGWGYYPLGWGWGGGWYGGYGGWYGHPYHGHGPYRFRGGAVSHSGFRGSSGFHGGMGGGFHGGGGGGFHGGGGFRGGR